MLGITYPRLDEEFVKVIIKHLDEGRYCRDICNKCIGHCSCKHKDRLARDVLIESFIPLAKSVAKRFRTDDDALSFALLALTQAVDSLHGGIKDVPNYLYTKVNFRVQNDVYLNRIIKIPKKSIRVDSVTALRFGAAALFEGATDPQAAVDLRDTIDSIIKNPSEKIVIQYLVQGGYTNKDIGEALHIHPTMVCKIKNDIRNALTEELL